MEEIDDDLALPDLLAFHFGGTGQASIDIKCRFYFLVAMQCA